MTLVIPIKHGLSISFYTVYVLIHVTRREIEFCVVDVRPNTKGYL